MNWILNIIKRIFTPSQQPIQDTIDELEYIPLATPPEPMPTTPPIVKVPTPSEHLYQVAFNLLTPAHDVSPKDLANDEVGCVETMWNVINIAFKQNVGFPIVLSTIELFAKLSQSPLYEKISIPELGSIAVCVTGTGNGNLTNGHTGIYGKNYYMSNSSKTGNFEANFSHQRWRDYYEFRGGMKTHYFKRIHY